VIDFSDKDKLFTIQEVQNAVFNYAKEHNLVDKRFIRLDDKMKALCNVFWRLGFSE